MWGGKEEAGESQDANLEGCQGRPAVKEAGLWMSREASTGAGAGARDAGHGGLLLDALFLLCQVFSSLPSIWPFLQLSQEHALSH